MPPLPWSAPAGGSAASTTQDGRVSTAEDAAESQVVVMASILRLKSPWKIPGFFRAAMAIRRQSLASNGLVGMTLDTDLPHSTFFTLSAWRDRTALNTFVASEPHRSLMRRYHPALADARFVFWDVKRGQLPPSWPDAKERLKAASQRPKS